jgi:hypothetical protein
VEPPAAGPICPVIFEAAPQNPNRLQPDGGCELEYERLFALDKIRTSFGVQSAGKTAAKCVDSTAYAIAGLSDCDRGSGAFEIARRGKSREPGPGDNHMLS